MALGNTEFFIQWVALVLGIATLVVALWQGVWRGLQHPAGRTTGIASRILRAPVLLVAALAWIGICFALWRPVPLSFPTSWRILSLLAGMLLYLSGIFLYLWGASTLGAMYKPSSGFGVQLNVDHQLITHGPFALVRHPMYLGLQMAAMGGLLIFWNWTFVFIALNFLGLFIRARREEEALAAEFGKKWEMHAGKVPAWLPRLRGISMLR